MVIFLIFKRVFRALFSSKSDCFGLSAKLDDLAEMERVLEAIIRRHQVRAADLKAQWSHTVARLCLQINALGNDLKMTRISMASSEEKTSSCSFDNRDGLDPHRFLKTFVESSSSNSELLRQIRYDVCEKIKSAMDEPEIISSSALCDIMDAKAVAMANDAGAGITNTAEAAKSRKISTPKRRLGTKPTHANLFDINVVPDQVSSDVWDRLTWTEMLIYHMSNAEEAAETVNVDQLAELALGAFQGLYGLDDNEISLLKMEARARIREDDYCWATPTTVMTDGSSLSDCDKESDEFYIQGGDFLNEC